MLSYRHAFHAGNHADILKHFVLYEILRYFRQREGKPFFYIDTHAGAGMYDLTQDFAQKNCEFAGGWQRLQTAENLCAPLADFRRHLQSFLPENHYCGSPALAASLLRDGDKMRLFELHSDDFSRLRDNMAGVSGCLMRQEDGFRGLLALLPPLPRRAVVLIDPPYECKEDYARLVETLQQALKRFATGCYVLWYPCLARKEAQRLPEVLRETFGVRFLHAQLWAAEPSAGFGMAGSGVFVVNPPYIAAEVFQAALAQLRELVAQDSAARYVWEFQAA